MITNAQHQHEKPRMRRFKRVGGTNIEQPQPQPDAPTTSVTLADFARFNQLPSVVRVVRGRFADIGCGPDDADAEIYVHSTSRTSGTTSGTKTTSSVIAEVMRYANDNEKQSAAGAWQTSGRPLGARLAASPAAGAKRLVATGRTICLPVNGREVVGCWFELLSEDGRAAPPIQTVEALANRALRLPGGGGGGPKLTTRYLVRQKVFGSIGSLSSVSVAIQPGDSLVPVRLVSSSPPGHVTSEHKRRTNHRLVQLQCFDGQRRSVFLPLDQKGLFSPIADSDELAEAMHPGSVGVVYDGIRSVVSAYRLPVTVRVVAGRLSIPDSVGVSSPLTIFRLTSISKFNNVNDDMKSNKFQTEMNVEQDQQTIYVMSLRHAWSLGSVGPTSSTPDPYTAQDGDDDEWQTPLIGVPPNAARCLTVVAASRDFYVNWLSTDDGREVSRRCDRVIARHLAVDTGDHLESNPPHRTSSLTREDSDDDVVSWKLPRRPTSVDSGLASSALNDDLYDEIDHIYCMIRYGPGGRPVFVDHQPAPLTHRHRAQSCDDNIPVAGCRVEAAGGGYVPRGVAAVLNERSSPDFGRRANGCDPVGTGSGFRRPQLEDSSGVRWSSKSPSAVISMFRAATSRQQQQQSQQSQRPPSRFADHVPKSIGPGGRSEPGITSHQSSLVAHSRNGVDNGVMEFSPLAVVYSGGVGSEVDRESGHVTGADMTTTSGESVLLQQRKYVRRQSAHHDNVRMMVPSTDLATPSRSNAGGRARVGTSHRLKSTSADVIEADRRDVVVEMSSRSPSVITNDVNGLSTPRQTRKSTAFVATLSQSLVSALRRVGRRSNGRAVSASVEATPETTPADVVMRHKKRNVNKNNNKKRSKSDAKERQSTTWYDDVLSTAFTADNNNNDDDNVDEDVEVFDFDIGDGRPNKDVRREWYGTGRSRRSWVATSSAGVDDIRSSRQLFEKSRDPPLVINAGEVYLVAASQPTKRTKLPVDLFSGHRGMRTIADRSDDLGVYTRGQYTNLGAY